MTLDFGLPHLVFLYKVNEFFFTDVCRLAMFVCDKATEVFIPAERALLMLRSSEFKVSEYDYNVIFLFGKDKKGLSKSCKYPFGKSQLILSCFLYWLSSLFQWLKIEIL